MAQIQATAQVMDDGMNSTASEIPAFLGLTQQQSSLLVALYNETDPEFAQKLPTAMPIAAQQLSQEYEKRNSVAKKLERANVKYVDECTLFETVQQEAVQALSETDMDIDKAAKGLDLDEKNKDCSVHDLLLGSLLYGGLRREPSGPEDRASLSPVASPNFAGAKRLLERAFEKGYTMAAVQIGSLYTQEEKLASGKNLPGQDPKKLALEWYTKAANKCNPMACHKLGFFYENGIGCKQDIKRAIEYYEQAYEQGYPDSAHNLAIIYQGNSGATVNIKDLEKSISYFERAKQWGYAPSSNALGRLYLLMSKDSKVAADAGNPGNDPEEYVITGMELMENAANSGDPDAMLMLGLIFGSKEYGLYDMAKAQNYMELALIRGELEAYNYLVRILRAKMAAKVALEKENADTFEKLSQSDKEKLIRQLAKEAATSTSTATATSESGKHKKCGNSGCQKVEEEENSFKHCGQCQRVAYCSRECQKEHWKSGHKTVCSSTSNGGQ
ncbi:hypothetical protein J3Q64DRAFT_1714719 [Phycomyces blakesleeanus]|uniref:MYND-type domain-containing protein n=2 Tax=Phycomyces blakesleeanus TaxID=4837 RepID=A0A162V2J0_PHYB8|nr:hypothetical protein PHYBLDRAFT_179120 [Phycomyces blakesleeanus NRRL 1555(-)]OAD79512.1 hypothetical protein PHYBLDRAFT_179120 [Phycomyces blakesleeanus NRRL 1555(-)]|eukprot:XP_018297552.1 hypothetical protein PHYBLDRAFT_179120 [Phycomyces blakesleeanus NRRL 1555(-)]